MLQELIKKALLTPYQAWVHWENPKREFVTLQQPWHPRRHHPINSLAKETFHTKMPTAGRPLHVSHRRVPSARRGCALRVILPLNPQSHNQISYLKAKHFRSVKVSEGKTGVTKHPHYGVLRMCNLKNDERRDERETTPNNSYSVYIFQIP